MNLHFRPSLFDRRCIIAIAIFFAVGAVFATGVNAQDDEQPDAVAIFNQGQDLHEKGDLTGAIKLYDQALKIIPEFPEALYQRGLAELVLGNKTEAENSFRKAVELRPDWSLALSSLGSLLVTQKKYAEAGGVLSKAIELDGQNFPALSALTELRLKTKASPAELKDLLAKISALSAKANPPLSIFIARAALESALGDAKAARASINKVLSVEPSNKFALAQSAELSLAAGDIQRADSDCKQLEKISPNDETTAILRARIFMANGDLKEARGILDRFPQSPDAAELRQLIDTNSSVSAAELEKQLESDAKNPALLGRLCKLYRRDDPQKALDYCRRAMDIEPANTSHAVGFAAALVQARQFDAAVNLLKRLSTIEPDNSTIHANLGAALLLLKRYAEAKTEFEWLRRDQPKLPAVYFHLAIVHDHLGEFMDALANYQQFLRLADAEENKLEIEKVNLRLPVLQKLVKKK